MNPSLTNRLCTLSLLLALAACRGGDPAREGRTGPGSVSNNGFVARRLADSVKAMAIPTDAPPGVVTFSGDHRSVARVVFTGQTRPILAAHKSAILLAQKNTGTVPLADDVKSELLFREGDVEYWMPVGAKTEPDFKNLKPGREIDLYATFVAAMKDTSGRVDALFVAQEYLEPVAP